MDGVIIGFFATFLIWILYTGLLVLWFVDGRIRKEQVLHSLFAGVIAWGIAWAVKTLFPTVRPFVLNGRGTDVLIAPSDSAFPSAHTALAFSLAVTIFMHDRRVGFWYLLAAFLIGAARVLANVHYPMDIVGGAFIGTLIAVIVEKTHMFRFLSKK